MQTIEPCKDKVLLSVCTMDWCDHGVEFAKTVFSNLEVFCWDPGDPYPYHLDDWEGDWIISYRGDFIFPQSIYKNARKGAINLHPAPPNIGAWAASITRSTTTMKPTVRPAITWPLRWTAGRSSTWRASTLRLPRRLPRCACTWAPIACSSSFTCSPTTSCRRPLPVSPENWGERLYKQSELKPWMEKIRAQEPDHRCFK